ncbi:MAG: excinuclease ABC subunit UvrC, partial [Planctomycetota bacterium]
SLDGVSERPGVYLFKNDRGKVLYVGKARNLKARLRSYRRPGGDGRLMIRFLENEAESVETIITRTEQEALLLEDSLIKTHKPPHNIRLKDDKSFLMLRLDSGERFPRLKFVRAHSPKVGDPKGRTRFFGPFASSRSVRRTLSDLHRVVPLRDCPDSVLNHRTRPCLKHQIGLCSAPCVGLIDDAGYAELVERAARVLSGDTAELEQDLEERMRAASAELEFERAASWRDRLKALRRTVEGQGVQPPDNVPRDIIGLARRGDDALIHRLAFRDGRMSESRSHHFRSELPDAELLAGVLTALYTDGRRVLPNEIVLPCEPEEAEFLAENLGGVQFRVPTRGDRMRMLDLAGENARAELDRKAKEEAGERKALVDLTSLLDLDGSPEVIDCFDVSNFQGSNVVASRVRFRGGHADRAGYRRFKVRGLEEGAQDDFASMKEVVGR